MSIIDHEAVEETSATASARREALLAFFTPEEVAVARRLFKAFDAAGEPEPPHDFDVTLAEECGARWLALGCAAVALGARTTAPPAEPNDGRPAESEGAVTNDEIKAARALCDAATPGPWKHVRGPAARDVLYDANGRELLFTSNEYYARADLEENDAAFIAVARTLVPRLLDEVERLRTALAEAVGHQPLARPTTELRKRVKFPLCPVVGCTDEIDPRYSIHHDGRIIDACEGHGCLCSAPDGPCTCKACDSSKVSVLDTWRQQAP